MQTATVARVMLLAALGACTTADALEPMNAARTIDSKPTVVLVHGAFADASGWQAVISLLQQDGFKVVAVQNTLFSVAADVATTKRVIDAQTGPVIVVAHSYGGAVMTGAAAGNPNVRALVYVAALGLDVGEAAGPLFQQYPSPALAKFVPDAAGFLYIDPAAYPDVFAPDIPRRQAEAMAVAQKPIAATAFGETLQNAAWKTIPSWFIVAQDDQVINPDLERFFARRMNARITEMKSSHAVLLSHPQAVAKLIRQVAEGF